MMRTSPLISVIIPVYNVEKYLTQCIESVIHQTYDNLEIILVDDGSIDRGGDICDEYKDADQRVRVVHKINGGLSDARNVGMKIATGQYVMFVDSDDWINQEMAEKLYKQILKYDADMALCSYRCVDDGSSFQQRNEEKKEYVKCYCGLEALEAFVCSKIEGKGGAVWGQLIRYDLLSNLEFPYGRTYEDLVFNTVVFSRSSRTVFCSSQYYNYRVNREGSITGTQWTLKKVVDYDILSSEKIKYLQKIGQEELAKNVGYCTYVFFLDIYIKSLDYKIIKYLYSVLKENRRYVIRKPLHSICCKERFMVICSMISSSGCRYMYTIMRKTNVLKLVKRLVAR